MKRRSFNLMSVAAVFLITVFVPARAASAEPYVCTTLNPPNSNYSRAYGISNAGDVAGVYTKAGAANTFYGFLYSGGAYTTIELPIAVPEIQVCGVNDNGDIVGWYTNSSGDQYSFFYNGSTHTYTTLGDSNGGGDNLYSPYGLEVSGDSLYAYGINDSGDIVGEDNQGSFLATPQPLLLNAKNLGIGWYWSSWFGYFNTNGSPWIYHMQLGWLYPFGASTGSIWFWDPGMNTLLWTSATAYPYLYRANDGAWLWYGEGTSNPPLFYNFKKKGWEKG